MCPMAQPERERTIHDLGPNDLRRQRVEDALEAMRFFDKARRYRSNRIGIEYEEILLGLDYMFYALKWLSGPPVVLDIGAGTTEGAFDLQVLAEKHGLDMQATVLVEPFRQPHTLPAHKVRITSAEYLEGFGEATIRGVLALGSITYSAVPDLTIGRIDQVLVPGGILKAAFLADPLRSSEQKPFVHTRHQFVSTLEELSYDIATDDETSSGFDIVLAIKPGGTHMHNAQTLLDADRKPFVRMRIED